MMSLKLIDIHTHPQFAAYEVDRSLVMQRAEEASVGQVVVGTQKDTSLRAVELAQAYPHTWATVGLHPIHTTKSYHDKDEIEQPGSAANTEGFVSRGEKFDFEYYKKIGGDEKVVAIGECGLDYFHLDEKTKLKQMSVFDAQIALANELNKPLMIHIRQGKGAGGGAAYMDAFHLLHSKAKVKANVHFFAGDIETARKFLSLEYTLSFTGVITFTHDYDDVVKYVPLDSMMVETDAPYITPTPYRGKRNESSYVRLISARVALIKGLSVAETEQRLLGNAVRFFGLKF